MHFFLYICGLLHYFVTLYNNILTLNYKELFHRIVALLSSPAKTWDAIINAGDERMVLPGFVYPMIGLCGLSEFVGAFIGRDLVPDVFQVALTRSCGVCVSLFVGFFLASYLIKQINGRLNCETSDDEIQGFVGYSMVVTFVLQIVSSLFSILIIHWVLQIYTLFVVFEGARRMMKVCESRLTMYTIVTTLIILLSPSVIELIFDKLSVTLN